ncbi:MAG TPA: LuxR C-terminal-related transcriptional regulator, partial [Acidimicrobiales bacterium]|nr:LuxR C-terminal-related transcriptional regulator [Acidimicrobiales bacterium]
RMGELARARSLEEEVAEEARARGDELYYAQVCWGLCTVEWYDGRWEAALGRAKAAVEAGEHWRERHLACLAGRIMALVEADLGLVEEARATAERGVAIARELSDDYPEILALGVLGRIELMLGDPARAAAMLRGLPERLLGLGVVDPTPTVWADTIEALVAVGDGDSVAPLLDAWSDRASAISSPVALAMAGRCRGLLAAAHGQLSSANTEFEASLAALEGFTYPGERARTLMCQGVALRQANQRSAARESLEGAVAIFDALGGMLWAERARTELTRISGRRPASDALTDTERQVATHAAQGQSNKEIAASLHMGVSTVESHLSSIYRKLDVKRAQLAAALNEAQ